MKLIYQKPIVILSIYFSEDSVSNGSTFLTFGGNAERPLIEYNYDLTDGAGWHEEVF
mgnify:CR=1 FL=1